MQKTFSRALRGAFALAPLALAAGSAFGQATIKEDGQWRAALGASLSSSGGNTRTTTLVGLGDAARATANDKTSLYAIALYGTSQGSKTADLWRLGGKHDWNLSSQLYVFGLAELERDELARLQSRITLAGGAGWRIFHTDALRFEAFGGGGFVADDYKGARQLDGALRSNYSTAVLLAGEESVHKLGQSTTARQRLVLFPNVSNRGEYRLQWDAGIAVPASQSLNLTAGVSARFNSDPGSGVKRSDTLLTTGVTIKFD